MKKYLSQLIEGATLTREDTRTIMLGITEQKFNDYQIAALLMALQTTRWILLEQVETARTPSTSAPVQPLSLQEPDTRLPSTAMAAVPASAEPAMCWQATVLSLQII